MPIVIDRLLGFVASSRDQSGVGISNGLRVVSNLLQSTNYANVGPTVNDDETLGYSPGHLWVDELADVGYMCIDATTGAAIWYPFVSAFDSDAMMQAAVKNVANNQTKPASYGIEEATGGLVMHKRGQMVALGVAMSTGRTAGTCTVNVLKNGVVQAENVVIDATNPNSNYLVFLTPVDFVSGDVIQLETVTSGYSPNNDDASISLFYRNYST